MTTSHLIHTERNSSYALTLGPLSTVVAHTGQDRERQIEIRWQCTRLDMGRDAALELRERLGDALGLTHDAQYRLALANHDYADLKADFEKLAEENAALRAALERVGMAIPGVAS